MIINLLLVVCKIEEIHEITDAIFILNLRIFLIEKRLEY